MRRRVLLRWLCYLAGMLILALGIVLNSKVTLGVSPIVSVAFCVSELSGLNFGDTTLGWYCVFVLVELTLHTLRLRGRGELRGVLLKDVLQFPVSLVVTRFINLFSDLIPVFETAFPGQFWGSIPGRLVLLLAAIVLTGVGAAMSLQSRLVPNPGDGIVQAIADTVEREVGLVKNCFDVGCVTLTVAMGLLLGGRLIGVGVGTVAAMLGVGRVMALFNRLFGAKLRALTEESKENSHGG